MFPRIIANFKIFRFDKKLNINFIVSIFIFYQNDIKSANMFKILHIQFTEEKKYRKKIIAKKYSVDGIVPSNTISESQLRINLHSIGKWC